MKERWINIKYWGSLAVLGMLWGLAILVWLVWPIMGMF